MKRLSGRERILIYIAIVLLSIYISGIRFALPAWQRMEAMQKRLVQLELEWGTAELELSGLELLRESCALREANCMDIQERYHLISSNTKLEQAVLSCLERAGLSASSTVITTDALQKAVKGEAVSLQKGSIEVTASGERADCLRVLDEVNQNPLWHLAEYAIYLDEGTELTDVQLKLEYEMPLLTGEAISVPEETEDVS